MSTEDLNSVISFFKAFSAFVSASVPLFPIRAVGVSCTASNPAWVDSVESSTALRWKDNFWAVAIDAQCDSAASDVEPGFSHVS